MGEDIPPNLYWKQEPRWVRLLQGIALVNFFVFASVSMIWGVPIFDVQGADGSYVFENHGHSFVLTAGQYRLTVYEMYFTLAITSVAVIAWFWALVKKHQYA